MAVSFDGRTMNAPVTDPMGVINAETIFRFSQEGSVIKATYRGGKVIQGFLIGKLVKEKLEFQYTQMDTDHRLDGGHSICDIELLEDGRLRLTEHFDWSSRDSTGTNVIEELKPA